jgi:hypothetical protein
MITHAGFYARDDLVMLRKLAKVIAGCCFHIVFAQLRHLAGFNYRPFISPTRTDESYDFRHFLIRQAPGKPRHGEG